MRKIFDFIKLLFFMIFFSIGLVMIIKSFQSSDSGDTFAYLFLSIPTFFLSFLIYLTLRKRIFYKYEDMLSKMAEEKNQQAIEIDQLIIQKQDELNQILENIKLKNDDFLNAKEKVEGQVSRFKKLKELYSAINHAIKDYHSGAIDSIDQGQFDLVDSLSPSITLKLHHMDVKELRKAFKANEKDIETVLEEYQKRYTTKANKSIYQLMVIALKSELQNVLYNLKYDKLDASVSNIKTICYKYLNIADDGNKSIAKTIAQFIGEIEYLFTNAVKIEYNYYAKKEQAKQEQAAIREQMRQEAAEKKALEAEKKKIEQEEAKYLAEIEKLQSSLVEENNDAEVINARIIELQAQLSDVVVKKEEILNLQNGKAGNVYIISNLGSFGENVFKIGMTRRLEPQDRVDELGSASVPFKFDVHSFIFSEDAVALEASLHQKLNNQRVNKVNLRKEFFNISIDELESLVNEIEPTAEFNKTMLAEEFRQSLSTDEVYTSDFFYDDIDEEFEND